MGRMNRSRKRRDEMNKVKKTRNAAKDLLRLKKTLGLLDSDGNEIVKGAAEVATIKTPKELKMDKLLKEKQELEFEFEEERDKGENVTVVNEKTGKKHTYNTKTLKDEHGSYPPWYKPKKTAKRIRKLEHARKKRFRHAWNTVNVPL